MKKILSLLLVASALFTFALPVSATEANADNQNYRVPEAQSFNGILPDGTSIFDHNIQVPHNPSEILPRVFIGYEYVPGYEQLKNKTYDNTYDYIYGTSVTFVRGASPSYTLTVTKDTTNSTEWNIQGTLEGSFDVKMVKTTLAASGGYKNTMTAKISRGETWQCGFTTPGSYNLTWYQRAHNYTAYCGANYITTDVNDGKFTLVYIGTVTFPTDEVAFDVSYA